MKKIVISAVALTMALLCLAGCGNSKCKECDKDAYQDGYCEYHYALHAADEAVDDLTDNLIGTIFN